MEQAFFTVENICAAHRAGFSLREVSFSVEAGTLTALLGANGSGKTTLLRAICQQMRHEGSSRLQTGTIHAAQPCKADKLHPAAYRDFYGNVGFGRRIDGI